jgi:hypothetical protein
VIGVCEFVLNLLYCSVRMILQLHVDLLACINLWCGNAQPIWRHVCKRMSKVGVNSRKHYVSHYVHRVELLNWARANGCPWNEKTCATVTEGGHLEVLQWARANGCQWCAETCYWAASGGHMEVLQWARANGCEWDASTCSEAANGGHLDVLK